MSPFVKQTRRTVIREIMKQFMDDDIVVGSTGYISREIHHQKDRDLNFYMQGSMGCALSIGIGIALHVKSRVFVIAGDGATLMSLGTLVTARKLNLDNLYLIILDNSCHESTGGQPTSSLFVEFRNILPRTHIYSIEKCDSIPPRINMAPDKITERFKNAVHSLCCK